MVSRVFARTCLSSTSSNSAVAGKLLASQKHRETSHPLRSDPEVPLIPSTTSQSLSFFKFTSSWRTVALFVTVRFCVCCLKYIVHRFVFRSKPLFRQCGDFDLYMFCDFGLDCFPSRQEVPMTPTSNPRNQRPRTCVNLRVRWLSLLFSSFFLGWWSSLLSSSFSLGCLCPWALTLLTTWYCSSLLMAVAPLVAFLPE